MKQTLLLLIALFSTTNALAADKDTNVPGQSVEQPANKWSLIHRESADGGKTFARVIHAQDTGRLYLWGTGGKQPARNVYERYELEAFELDHPKWVPAFPAEADGKWTAESYPPFRILGQTGPDGLKFDEGPRLQVVGGYHATNRIQWWDFDGITRPSPISTFNMACWDGKRKRIVFYSDGCTFSLDPQTNSWTDLKAANFPTTCRTVAWGNLCYDVANDRIMLFGGGLATNPSGAAPTWFYDCKANEWKRPKLDVAPPPRCNGALEYVAAEQKMVLFGGYDQSAALNDTWVYDCTDDRWQRQDAKIAPPPMFAPAAAVLPGGRMLVCGNDARLIKRDNQGVTSATKETWVYDTTSNEWSPIDADLKLPGYTWLTATATGDNSAILVAFGPERQTYALGYDPAVPKCELPGAPPNTVAWKYPEQKLSLEHAPPPTPESQLKLLSALPANQFVNAEPPGMLISKTWSTAVIDTDRSEVLYLGGGHSGYSGNDIARYSVTDNRWTQDFPPRFPPFLESTNAGIFGWSYGMMPFSQHTYLWYCYDPLSKTVVYLARPSLRDGLEVQLDDDPTDTFVWSAQEHGHASWVYDPAKKKMLRPSFGRTFTNPWHLTLAGTPQGVFAVAEEKLYHGTVDRELGTVNWKLIDGEYPQPKEEIKYHYEFQPLLYDSKRERLLQLKGDDSRVDVFVRAIDGQQGWQSLVTEGTAAIGREAVYIPQHDTVLWLGKKLYALDLATNRMAEVEVALPEGLYTHECAMVYDPAHDVCIALIPRSFTGPMQTFLFRHEPTSLK